MHSTNHSVQSPKPQTKVQGLNSLYRMQTLLFGAQTLSLRTATPHFMFLLSPLGFQILFPEPRNNYKNDSVDNESELGALLSHLGLYRNEGSDRLWDSEEGLEPQQANIEVATTKIKRP